jgi:hypothetical protein
LKQKKLCFVSKSTLPSGMMSFDQPARFSETYALSPWLSSPRKPSGRRQQLRWAIW